jgi:hypothetical protein
MKMEDGMKRRRKKKKECHTHIAQCALNPNWKEVGYLSQKDFAVAIDEMLLNLMSEELKNWFKEEGGYEYD